MFEERLTTQNEAIELMLSLDGYGLTTVGLDLALDKTTAVLSVKRAFEYRMVGVAGVKATEHGIAWEREFISNKIDIDQIVEFREVILFQLAKVSPDKSLTETEKKTLTAEEVNRRFFWSSHANYKIFFSPWMRMP